MSSDQPSLSGLSTFASPPPSVKPEPAYLAPSAAAQIVTSNHHFHSQDWFDENGSQPSTETALVSPASLVLVNSFLDQLLYNFLLTARSTSLASLRPAVSEVLKPRLAREAIAGADEELQEFLGGGDDEELSTFHHGQESGGDCDIELVWKRTRLRCMVYTRLGDMEEEEEDMWVERENLEDFGGRHRRFSHELGVVSPAVAIFLTSILEFIGEHALMVAGEAAYARILKSTNVKAQPMPQSGGYAERFVVEEMDMEKVAFNTTLGRLWRTWRKRIRSPTSASSRGFSYQRTHSGPFSSSASRKSSIGALDEAIAHSDLAHGPSVAEMLHKDDPASNCLPVAGQTTEECEPADVAAENDDHPRHAPKSSGHAKKRPRSMLVFPSTFIDPSTPSSTRSHSPDPFVQSNSVTRHILPRRRSRSLPTSQQPSFISADGSQPQFSTQHAAAAPTTSHETGIDHSGDRQGLVAGILAGVRASGVAAIASITNITNGAASEAPLAELERSSTVDTDIEKHGFNDDEEPQILNTTRISMEGARSPVEILQTRSRAASSAHSFKTSDTPQAKDQSQRASVARSPTARTLSDGFPSPDVSPHKEASGNVVEDSSYFAKQDLMQGETNQPAASADDQISTGEKRDSRFVFPSLLPPRSQRTSGTSTLSGRDLLPDGTLITPTTESPRLSLGHGSPALTPLPEMIEDGHETTDEASSLPSDQDAHSSSSGIPSERAQNGESQKHDSYSSSAHTHAKHSPNSSRVTDLRNDLPPRRSGSSTGKVNSERGTITPVSRRSGSSGRDNRPIPTSGSSTSQAGNKIKGLKDRHRAASDKPSLVLRTSSDGSESVVRGKHSQTISGPEDKQRSFEKLIRSDETLQYTLTPQTVRDMEVRSSGTLRRWHSLIAV